MKIKRKARTKLIKTVDTLKPITIMDLGSEDDPCFGKHFSPLASECNRCGDSELCAIKMGQSNHKVRSKIEKKQAFKDIEEQDIPEPSRDEIRKKIKLRIRELIKLSGAVGIKEDAIGNELFITYSKDGFTKGNIRSILKKVIERSTYITYKNDKLVWNR